MRLNVPTQWIGAKKASEILGIAERTIRVYAQQGEIPCYKVGTRVLFGIEELTAWMMGRKVR